MKTASKGAAAERRSSWIIMGCAAAILAITMGIRQTSGLFIDPINNSTGLGIVAISFALAVSQFVWGLVQPLFGAIADKRGPLATLVSGALLLAAGLALTPFAARSEWMLVMTLGILTAAGAGAGSFSVLIGASAQRLPAERRSFAAGFINAGGSFGQFVFAPLVQAVISSFGWIVAMFALAASALATIPLSWTVSRDVPAHVSADPLPSSGLLAQIRTSMGDISYLCLHGGFFTCGFHIAFLVTHLPGEVALCGNSAAVSAASIGLIGLFNIAGSLCAGWLGSFCRMKYILAVMYASRAVIIAIYLLSPKDPLTFYVFAAALGFTWLATV
ncbi:MAG TPA: MFS transporter, partial [Rhodospirillales bacterium]|nr:MFS transporter [Rhodospirillales bacterium]